MTYELVITAPYLEPVLYFVKQYGLVVIGAVVVLAALTGRRFGPLALIPLVFGLGIVIAGAARFFPFGG